MTLSVCGDHEWLNVAKLIGPSVTQKMLCFLGNLNVHENLLWAHVLSQMNTGHIPCYHISLISILLLSFYPCWGIRWHIWLRHCAISWKVSGSIPDGVIGVFHWHNPSGRTMALRSTQPLAGMITRNISWMERQPAHRADDLTTIMCWLSWNLGASTFWNPQDLSTPVQGLLYLYRSTLLSPDRFSVSYLSTINFTSVSALCATCPKQ